MISILDRKLLRELGRMWVQALAIALVIAAGVATLILSTGTYRSLYETRDAYYDRYQFADVFALLRRAPSSVEDRILEISGIAAVETRIVKTALVDIADMPEPVTAQVISLPERGMPKLNRLYLRSGRLPDPGSRAEAVINEGFAKAHGFTEGSRFKVLLNGRQQVLKVTGVALSPEFIYALGPGDMIPDDRRYGIVWMSLKSLEATFDLENSFNSVGVKLLRDASRDAVIDTLDRLLKRYGGLAAHGRKDQQSHAFIDAELNQLSAMGKIFPPIFLGVSAFLINVILSRIVLLQREQIGVLKAIGYSRAAIAVHYLKFVMLIAVTGTIIGIAVGVWLGHGLTRLYTEFFSFPFLIFKKSPDLYAIGAVVSLAAAALGGYRSVASAVALPPAVAMQPPAPTGYGHLWTEKIKLFVVWSQPTRMVLRHMFRWPVRSALTALGLAMMVGLLVGSLFSLDSIEHMIDFTFFQSDRQDATVTFADNKADNALQSVAQLPGVLRAEPYRAISVRLRNRHFNRSVSILGKPPDARLSRVLELNLRPLTLPKDGLAMSEKLANLIDIRRGDVIEAEVLEGSRKTFRMPVTDIVSGYDPDAGVQAVFVPVTRLIQSYLGLTAYMDLDALNAMVDEGPRISGVHISYDRNLADKLFAEVKAIPAVASITLQKASLAKFRETLAKNIVIMITVYVTLGVVVTFGVVYNSARIHLSERARELASLRVLGFTRWETFRILFLELVLITTAAVPVGWGIGYLIAWVTVRGLDSDLYRVPFIINASTYAIAALIVVLASVVSAIVVKRRVDRLDMISVLKTRD